MNTQERLHKNISANRQKVDEWFVEKSRDLQFPFYSSFDIRDAGFKIAPVDANLYPAGFNNICTVDKESANEIVAFYLKSHYKLPSNRILLLTEEHTQNAYYWDNVWTLKHLITEAGYEVKVSFPKALEASIEVTSASGKLVKVEPTLKKDGRLFIGDWSPDLIISNNDFSQGNEDWAEGLKTPINPPREMGWYQRRKSRFFEIYNHLAEELAQLIDIDPWEVQVESQVFPHFEVDSADSRKALAAACKVQMEKVKGQYQTRGLKNDPFLFVKNDAGTYGLGVIQVAHAEDVEAWTYKSRKRMKASKGGGGISQVIIQEGIPTQVRDGEGQVSEPAIYMIGCQLVGGFLRTHSEKSETESLNSPGAVYKRLCVSDLKVDLEGSPQENAYGWIARLAFLAVAKEAKESQVHMVDYIGGPATCTLNS